MFRFQGLGTIENYHDVSFRKPAPSTDVLRVSQCLRRKGVKPAEKPGGCWSTDKHRTLQHKSLINTADGQNPALPIIIKEYTIIPIV